MFQICEAEALQPHILDIFQELLGGKVHFTQSRPGQLGPDIRGTVGQHTVVAGGAEEQQRWGCQG